METIYDVRRRPIAKMDDQGRVIYLKSCEGRLIAKFDSQSNLTYDSNGKMVGRGNILQRLIPA